MIETDAQWATAGRDVLRRLNDANQVGPAAPIPARMPLWPAVAIAAVMCGVVVTVGSAIRW